MKTGAFVCHACGAATPEWAGWCRACNYVGAIGWKRDARVNEEPSIEPEGDLDGPMVAGDVTPTEKICVPTGIVGFDRVLTGGFYKEKTGEGIRGSTVLLSGRRGGGKSRVTLAALSKPANRRMKCLYVSSEEQIERLSRYVREGGLSDKIHLYHTLEFERGVDLAVNGFRGVKGPLDIVVFDSAQKFKLEGGRKLTKLSEMLREVTKSYPIVGVLLSQENAQGDPSGTNELGHDADVVLRVERHDNNTRTLSCVAKNRFGADDGEWTFGISSTASGIRFTDAERPGRAPAGDAPSETPRSTNEKPYRGRVFVTRDRVKPFAVEPDPTKPDPTEITAPETLLGDDPRGIPKRHRLRLVTNKETDE
jgi:DNA repair protein RadA/Sms